MATTEHSFGRYATALHKWIKRPLVALSALFVASRAIFYWAGVRFDPSEIQGGPSSDPWQLLDRHLLRTQLLSSVWHLNSQPPLFNLYCGILLKLPYGLQEPAAEFSFLGLGLVIVLSAYQAMVDLRVPRWLSFTVAGLIVLSPSYILYENWLSYAYPTAAFLSFAALCCIRYLRTMSWAWGSAFLLSIAAVVLTNSTYQGLWLVVIVGLVLLGFRKRWRRTLVVAIIPLVAVGTWYVKDYAQFGTLTTSSWLGMNLAQITLLDAPPGVVSSLVKEGKLTPLSEVFPFTGVGGYVPYWTKAAPHTGIPALDEAFKRDGQNNYNNLVYVKVSSLYLHDDLAFIELRPGDYLHMVVRSATLFFVPADEYAFVSKNERTISHWTRLYDGVALWQVSNQRNAAHRAIYHDQGPEPLQIPYATILVWLLALFGTPVAAFYLRKTDRAAATTLAVIWVIIVYGYVTSALLEFGEDERLRFEIGTPPAIAATVVAATFVRWLTARRTGACSTTTEPEQERSAEPVAGPQVLSG